MTDASVCNTNTLKIFKLCKAMFFRILQHFISGGSFYLHSVSFQLFVRNIPGN